MILQKEKIYHELSQAHGMVKHVEGLMVDFGENLSNKQLKKIRKLLDKIYDNLYELEEMFYQ